MIKVNVDISDFRNRLRAELGSEGRVIRSATLRALNSAGFSAMQAAEKEILKIFDRPTPWIQKGVRYTKARYNNLEVKIGFDLWGNKSGVTASQVLNAEIWGGSRRLKRHEVALRRMGILPEGMTIVPGEAAKLDAYGNMQSGQIVQILSWFQAFGEQGYRANMNNSGKSRLMRGSKKAGSRGFSYFVLKKLHGKLLPGIYQRYEFATSGVRKAQITDTSVKPVMIFVRTTHYKRRFDFFNLTERAAKLEFDKQFPLFMQEEMRLAK